MTNIRKEDVKQAMEEVLMEVGMIPSMLSKNEAQKRFGFTRRQVDNGIKDGSLRATEKKGKTSKQLIPREDLINYREKLLNTNHLKIS